MYNLKQVDELFIVSLISLVINVDIEPWSSSVMASYYIGVLLMQNKVMIGQTFIVRDTEDTDSDIIGLGFLITSSLMWISNRGHVFRDGGIILHPNGVFSNVLMQKKRHGIRKTSDLSKSDCSLHDICQQRYLVYYESYRDEIVQGRVRSEIASFDKI